MRLKTCASALAVIMVPLPALAESPGQPPPSSIAGDPQPSLAERMASLYPDRAQRMQKSGRASIGCTVTLSGRLKACTVLSEEPAGYGFGMATLRMTPYLQMHPASRDGHPVEGHVVIPIRWRLAPRPAPPANAASPAQPVAPPPGS